MAGGQGQGTLRRRLAVTGLGKTRRDLTVVHLSFGTGESSTGYASDLYSRKPEPKGKDKP